MDGIEDEFIIDEEKEPMKAAVAKAGGDCLIALGVFELGVACISWSPDSSQIVTTSRDWKNTIRCFHVRKNGSNFGA
jgi:WD40 repeat protein